MLSYRENYRQKMEYCFILVEYGFSPWVVKKLLYFFMCNFNILQAIKIGMGVAF
jgi:hypothetical protein